MTRMRLIEAAETLFIRKGFDDTSVDEISEMAGYSRGAFYSNFDDKEQVFLAVIDRRRPTQSPRRHLPTDIRTRGADRRGSGVVLESMAAQGLHRPANGIQPKGDERSLRTEAPRGTPAAGTRNVRRFRGPVSWRDSDGVPADRPEIRRACTVGGCTRPGRALAIDTDPEWNTCTRRPPGWHSIA